MKRLSIVAVLIVCFVSFLLLRIDSQSKQGILNSLGMGKIENSNSQEISDSTKLKEKQDVQ
jgi:hypothetical protein